ncbi:MAG: methyltransferase [Rhizobiales bacterium]|nr:methyltransferase [Hyphomicrobiales bacterium]
MSRHQTPLTPELLAYLERISPAEPAPMAALASAADQLEHANWRASSAEARLLALLVRLMGARRCLEIGTFVGYSTLWIASALPADGRIVTFDIMDEYPAVGRPFWEAAGVTGRIDLRIAPALEALPSLIAEGGPGSFDMAFIDADKKNYPKYYELCLELVRPGGLIAVDNTLWSGQVIDPSDTSKATEGIRALNARIAADPRIEAAPLSCGDGLTLVLKRGA